LAEVLSSLLGSAKKCPVALWPSNMIGGYIILHQRLVIEEYSMVISHQALHVSIRAILLLRSGNCL
jgi:hypothetical protein